MKSIFYLFSLQVFGASAYNSTNAIMDDHFRLLRGKEKKGGMGMGYGYGGGTMSTNGGVKKGGMGMGGRWEIMQTIHNLFDNRGRIERYVEVKDDGVKTYTNSSDSQVASWIIKHVNDMKQLMEQNRGIRLWDDLFEKAFEYHDLNSLSITEVPGGVEVVHKVNDIDDDEAGCVVAIIHEHAGVVSDFITFGMDEAHVNHEVPIECDGL